MEMDPRLPPEELAKREESNQELGEWLNEKILGVKFRLNSTIRVESLQQDGHFVVGIVDEVDEEEVDQHAVKTVYGLDGLEPGNWTGWYVDSELDEFTYVSGNPSILPVLFVTRKWSVTSMWDPEEAKTGDTVIVWRGQFEQLILGDRQPDGRWKFDGFDKDYKFAPEPIWPEQAICSIEA